MINDILLAGNKAKGQRPYFFNDKAVERVLNITIALAGELAITHDRLDTLERLLEAKGIIARPEIEQFKPTPEQAEARQRWQAEYVARTLRIVQQELEAMQQPAEYNQNVEEIAEVLGKL
jgi:hypothetical protein